MLMSRATGAGPMDWAPRPLRAALERALLRWRGGSTTRRAESQLVRTLAWLGDTAVRQQRRPEEVVLVYRAAWDALFRRSDGAGEQRGLLYYGTLNRCLAAYTTRLATPSRTAS
jgi:hypothetical protein